MLMVTGIWICLQVGRVVPGLFPVSPASVLLLNNGKGAFADATARMCPALETAGMVTDAVWADVNNDRLPDLMTVGEWCPIKVYVNDKGVLKDASAQYIPFPSNGLWNSLLPQQTWTTMAVPILLPETKD
jgi:hypothetical protein